MEMKTPEDICGDFREWPKRWMGTEKDLVYGAELLEIMRGFVQHLITAGLADRTIRNHMDNLWLLGGEIIRYVNMYERYTVPALEELLNSVGHDGGRYCHHLSSEAQQRSYDSTCRKLAKYLNQTSQSTGS